MILLAIGSVFAIAAFAETQVHVAVTDEADAPLSSSLTLNGGAQIHSDTGLFTINRPDDGTVSLAVSADGYYAMRHVFSAGELENRAAIDPIVLVRKKANRTLMIFAGDAMLGRRFFTPHDGEPVLARVGTLAADARALLRHVEPYFGLADFASVNLETQILETIPEDKAPKSVVFHSPPELIDALLDAGVDYVSLGNNHTYDYLQDGLDQTREMLDERGLAYSGAGNNRSDAVAPYITLLDGASYAFQAYVGWSGGGAITQSADDAKGGAALGDHPTLVAAARRDRSAGHVPIVQYHGGFEYSDGPSLSMETRLKAALDAGAELAIGHHPHVFQGLELYNGKLIAWSLGNFLFDQYFYSAQPSALLFIWMDEGTFHRAEIVPTYLKGYTPTPATGTMRQAILRRIASLSAERDTWLVASGGHAALTTTTDAPDPSSYLLSPGMFDSAGIASLRSMHWTGTVSGTSISQGSAQVRFGRDLLARGGFEDHDAFDSPDRSWLDLDEAIQITDQDEISSTTMTMSVGAGEELTTGMRKFTRVYSPGTPVTVSAMVRASTDVKIKVWLQERRDRQSLGDALERGRKTLIGEQLIPAGELTSIAMGFDSPRIGTRSIRFLIEAAGDNGEAGTVSLDELALIEWTTPITPAGVPLDKSRTAQSSHIQVFGSAGQPVTITTGEREIAR